MTPRTRDRSRDPLSGSSDHSGTPSDLPLETSLEQLMQELARAPHPRHDHDGGQLRGSSPQLGDVLAGRYRLNGLLGGGGMGVVYGATHVHTGREVAVKVLRADGERDDKWDERVQRFVREATAAGRVKHPNVVDVYDVDLHRGAPFLVMERLEGESLRQRLKRGPLPRELAIEVMRAAMRGVAEVHRRAVIHRDLKPDNIFLARYPGEGDEPKIVPKVLDFGVSRVLSLGSERKPTTLTREGSMLGTPAYMALEQLRGERNVDARADVYALGVILYECLSGRRPYAGNNGNDLVARILTEPPVPLRRYLPQLSERCEAVVMRALARNAHERYASVEAFDLALQEVEHGGLGFSRKRALRGALGFALGATCAGALVWLLPASPMRHASPPPPPTPVLSARVGSPSPNVTRASAPTSSTTPAPQAQLTPRHARFATASARDPEHARERNARPVAKAQPRRKSSDQPATPVDHATLLLPNDF